MITFREVLWLMSGIAYGMSIMGVYMIWMKATTMEWKHHDGINTYEVTPPSFGRIYCVVIASALWPLSLLMLIAYGLLRIPLLIYQKTEKKDAL